MDKYIVQQGNFWAILEMMAKRDDTLREHLETGRKNAQYTSRIIHNEVIDVVVEYVRKENTRSLEDENAFFSIMADEITDPPGKPEIMSVCLRMLIGCKVKEFFFDCIYHLIVYRIKLLYQTAMYVHCSSHVLNLSIANACRLPAIRNMVDTLNTVFLFFDLSPNDNDSKNES